MEISGLDLRELTAGPNGDTRQWLSYGVVDDDQEESKSVEFTEEHGPLVLVTLQPSGLPVRCRVGGSVAGNGEAEWFPLISGDEVMVMVPEGDERAGCIIVSRCNNQLDRFPLTVGGQDVTKNAVAFKRVRCPYVFETADSYLLRAATAGNFLLLEQGGNCTLSDGFKDFVHVGADFVGLQASDADGAPTLLLQLMKDAGVLTLEATEGGKLSLGVDGLASWYATKTISLGAGGQVAGEHAASVEGMANLLSGVLVGLAALSAPGALSGLSVPGAAQTLVAAAIALAAGTPITPAITGAIATALAAKQQNASGVNPNVGCPSLLIG